MTQNVPNPRPIDPAAVVAGYLNFSSGAFDPTVWQAMSDLYGSLEPAGPDGFEERPDTAGRVAAAIGDRLAELEATQPAFRDAKQARRMLKATFDELLPAYRRYHADLLEHQIPGALERPYFVMAAASALLTEIATGDSPEVDESVVAKAIERLNDYVGWRPVAVLENGRLSAAYPHERVRPLPLFVAGAGPAHGRYRDLVAGALDILAATPAALLRQADFDLDALEELALDPRAFDFMHPAASRPNYLFGLWDPARIDEQGRYRRLVVQQATLDGILSWPRDAAEGRGDATIEAERRWESSAVLAGVVLMAAGLSGHGPGAMHASLGLGELLPRIAGYRDEFYRWLLSQAPAHQRQRLEEEAARLRQPFGGVRRHINATLARRRARQVEHVALAAIMARLARGSSAEALAAEVPAASARLFARITGRVVAARQSLRQRGDPRAALADLDEATDLLFRAVGCGAAVDPWNILGLAGQFPLHEPSGESLPDPRVDDLVNVTATILDGYAAAWRKASLAGHAAIAASIRGGFEKLAGWWDRHATTTVSGVSYLSGRECIESAREVIEALSQRRALAPASPPPGFWRKAVAGFSSPRSHAQAAEALLEEGDLDGAAGLLVHWASILEGPAIEQTGPTWLAAAGQWLTRAAADASADGRARVRRFLELVEANTSGVVDLLEAAAAGKEPRGGDPGDFLPDDEDEHDDGEERLAAAYESMVWRDSTDDGVDDGMLDVDMPGATDSSGVAAIEDAAEFLTGILRLYRTSITAWCTSDARKPLDVSREAVDAVVGWRHSIRRLSRMFVRAALAVSGRDSEPPPGMAPLEFDKLRWQRDAAAERLIDAAVQADETRQTLSTWLHLVRRGKKLEPTTSRGAVARLLAAAIRGDATTVKALLPSVKEKLAGKPVLYVPLARGGRPDRIVRARARERLLERLGTVLPRLGLVEETVEFVRLAKALESRRPAGGASVSEFDRVFEAATTALVERIVESSLGHDAPSADSTSRILDGLSQLVPRLLETWLTHARQLRLSVLERLRDDKAFAGTREFIEHYGTGLFTQHLLAPMSLRGILRGGVRPYLERLVEQLEAEPDDGTGRDKWPVRLATDLASGVLPMKQATSRLRLILESIAENHAEYRDWNSTTTQSDRGEHLHILLDHLRLKAEYDRIAWTLRPVDMAHGVLARRGAIDAAAAWRGRMQEETHGTAEGLVIRLDAIEKQWGVRLASIADRVRRPFTVALEQDELEALVPSAVSELMSGEPAGAGEALEHKARSFLGVASGSGVEVPEWLERLSAAVDAAIERSDATAGTSPVVVEPEALDSIASAVPWLPLDWPDLRKALGG
jgi:antitoxin (DNA-binding transcriptional repressor) of toxin-antitoxin stability system